MTDSAPRPCACGAERIVLSDGSSVWGWKCTACGHTWPRTPTERGMYKYRQVCSPDPWRYKEDGYDH